MSKIHIVRQSIFCSCKVFQMDFLYYNYTKLLHSVEPYKFAELITFSFCNI